MNVQQSLGLNCGLHAGDLMNKLSNSLILSVFLTTYLIPTQPGFCLQDLNLSEPGASESISFTTVVDKVKDIASGAKNSIVKFGETVIEGGKSVIARAKTAVTDASDFTKDAIRAEVIAEGIYEDVGALATFDTASKRMIRGLSKTAQVAEDDLGYALQGIKSVSGKGAAAGIVELTAMASDAKKTMPAFLSELKALGREKGMLGAMTELQQIAQKSGKTVPDLMKDLTVIGQEKGALGILSDMKAILPVNAGVAGTETALVQFAGELTRIGGEKGLIGAMDELRSTAKSAGMEFNDFMGILDFNDRAKYIEQLRGLAKASGAADLPAFAADLKTIGKGSFSQGLSDMSRIATKLGTNPSELATQLRAFGGSGGITKAMEDLGKLTSTVGLDVADFTAQLKTIGGGTNFADGLAKLETTAQKTNMALPDLLGTLKNIGIKAEGATKTAVVDLAASEQQLSALAKSLTYQGVPDLVASLGKLPKEGVAQAVNDLLLIQKTNFGYGADIWKELARVGGENGIVSGINKLRTDRVLEILDFSADNNEAVKAFLTRVAMVESPVAEGKGYVQGAVDIAKGAGGAVWDASKKLLGWGK